MVGVGRLALPRLFGFEPKRSAVSRLTTRRSAPRDLHPEGSAILSRWGLLFPLRPGAVKLVGMKGLAPPRLPDSESGPSSIRVKPHAQLEMVLPAGISPATWRFEAARSDSLSYGSMKWGRRGDSHSRGANRPAVYETAAVAAEPRRHEIGGSPRCCPVLCGLRDRCIAAMLATQSRHEGGVEPPQPGL
jgi:hypothetical protein